MKERDYINATNLAKVRAAMSILSDIFPSGVAIKRDELAHVARCMEAWQARLEREVSPETKRENKEPWLTEFPQFGSRSTKA